MRKNALNVVIFMFLAGVMFFLWQQIEKNMPKKDAKKDDPAVVDDQKKKDEQAKKDEEAKQAATKRLDALTAFGGGMAVAVDLAAPPPKTPDPKEPPKVAQPGPPPARTEPPRLVRLGEEGYYNYVLLTTQGAGVQQVVLPKFGQSDRLGREVKKKDANGAPTKEALPLYLIPGVPPVRGKYLREEYAVPPLAPGKVTDESILAEPSYTVFHYPTDKDTTPDPLLGEKNWTVVSEDRPPGGEHKVVFETELGDPYFLKLRKIYTLGPKDYHLGLRLEIERLNVPGAAKGKGQTRLQISGPRGLPIDAEWSTTTYRNAIIGWTDAKGTPRRQIEDGMVVGAKRGGDAVPRGDNTFKYMAVANSFFASGLAVSDKSKEDGAAEHPWAYVRATTELPFGTQQNQTMPYFDDLTVRAATETIDLAPGEKIAHLYLIYNGPAKVRLLKLVGEDRGKVDTALVDRYKDALALQTITDFHSDTMLGRFLNKIAWSDLVIACTNLMHWFLAIIHKVIPNWALSIVILTIVVRLLLFYPSRKQTAMSMKMMEVQKQLKPELDKLQEKYKDDMGAYNREKMRLMMARGVNPAAPLGGCLLFLAQAPIMMGLYFCLQESVFFRLEPFLWLDNLAAPDMMIWWSEKIPFLSTPEDIGSFIYLGPYFNLLPVLAVGLMLYQQAKMMPPSGDPQAEQQRMMMKIMMCMMAFFFYKVAAGLALYFIVSTAWGIIERQFIPKPEIKLDAPKTPTAAGGKMTPEEAKAAALAQKPKGLLGRLREALQKRLEEAQRRADEQSKRQIVNDPNRPAGGGGGGGNQSGQQQGNQGPPPGTIPRRDKKKKRRK